MTSDIGEDHRRAVEALTGGEVGKLYLFPCFAQGEAAAAIAAVTVCLSEDEDGAPGRQAGAMRRARDGGLRRSRSMQVGAIGENTSSTAGSWWTFALRHKATVPTHRVKPRGDSFE